MFDQKEGKKRALKVLRAYWMVFVFLRLLQGALGTVHSGSFNVLSDGLHALTPSETEEVDEGRIYEKVPVHRMVFLAVFSMDCVYSNIHSNTTEGVTSCVESEIVENVA